MIRLIYVGLGFVAGLYAEQNYENEISPDVQGLAKARGLSSRADGQAMMPVIKPNEWMDKIRGTLPVPKMPQKKIKVEEKTDSSSTESPS